MHSLKSAFQIFDSVETDSLTNHRSLHLEK